MKVKLFSCFMGTNRFGTITCNWRDVNNVVKQHTAYTYSREGTQHENFNSYSASHDNWCAETLWNRVITAQCEGMGEVGSARYEPALLPPCPSIRVLSYSYCQSVEQFTYLGCAISSNARIDGEIDNRLAKANSAFSGAAKGKIVQIVIQAPNLAQWFSWVY